MHAARANSERHVGLVVATVLPLDLLATLMRGWKAVAVVVAAIAVWLLLRAWLRRPRVAPRPAEHAEDAPRFVMGAPHIDARLWAKVVGAMSVEHAARQAAAMAPALGEKTVAGYLAQGDEGQDESRDGFVEAPPRSGARERRPYRRTAP